MTQESYSDPSREPVLTIMNHLQSLIHDGMELVPPEKLPDYRRVTHQIQARYPIASFFNSESIKEPLIQYKNEVIKSLRDFSSMENWYSIRPRCQEIANTLERIDRIRMFENPADWIEDIEPTLKFMYEMGRDEDLTLLREKRLAAALVTSKAIAQKFNLAIQKILSRAAHLEWLNPWMAACSVGIEISEDQKADLLDEILKASENQAALLMELAEARGCQSIYRRAAIWRLYEISKNAHTVWFLRVLFDPEEPDEEVRISAYENYLAMRKNIGFPQEQNEIDEEKQSSLSDPSPRMRWLFSLGH